MRSGWWQQNPLLRACRYPENRALLSDTTDNLEERVKTFFGGAKKLKPSEREQEFEAIKRDYYKTLDDSGGRQLRGPVGLTTGGDSAQGVNQSEVDILG